MTGAPTGSPARTAQQVIAVLSHRGETVATAESLTGGMLGALITAVPGASACYVGGVISYATRLKSELAGVPPRLLATHGPVAAETAVAMAAGVTVRCSATWGLATTGVAGPDAQDGHPVGQVFVAVAGPSGFTPQVRELRVSGDRAAVRTAAAEGALRLLAEVLDPV